MYTINGEYIKKSSFKKQERIIENMDNSTASFNTLRFHDDNKKPVSLSYVGNKIMLSQQGENNSLSTMLDFDFAKKTVGIYSNSNFQNNISFIPDPSDKKPEVNKGLMFYNKNKKVVASIHKDSKDKSDIVFRTGFSNESGFDLTERMRIKNSENRVKVSGTLDADELCLGDTCIDKSDLLWIKTRGNTILSEKKEK